MSLKPGERVRWYEVGKPLGSGGMGELYRARDTRLGRDVALKVLRGEFAADPERRRRFEREARSASALNHPNIVTVYDIGEHSTGPFLVMELVEGVTLRELLEKGALPIERLLAIATQIVDGLSKAHAAGIVHRDLKPENIMVTDDGLVKILDFGLAKTLPFAGRDSEIATIDREGTADGVILGTVGYMSPEQGSAGDVDFRADQFALGAILYEMASGKRAFERPTPVQTLAALIEAEPEPLEEYLPPSFSELVERLLRKDPRDRYGDTSEVLALVRAVEAPETGLPCPRCKNVVPRGHRFCGQCGGAVEAAVALESTERKQAVVVHTSLSGYAGILDQLASGEMERWVADLEMIARESFSRFGGALLSFSGGVIVGVFGIPTAHEDDDVQAVRAAEALHARARELTATIAERLPRALGLHTGIDTGAVVVHGTDDPAKGLELAGDVMNVAERLGNQADAGQILTTQEMERLVAPFFETEKREALRIPGRDTPVATYRILGESGARSRFDAAAKLGLGTFAGRSEELATLESLVRKASSGAGQFVAVVGDAGVGKSRLLYELRTTIGEPANVQILQGRCQAYGTTTALFPFTEALRDVLDVSEGAPDVETVVSRVHAIDPSLDAFVPFYLQLLAIPSAEHPLPEHLGRDDTRLAALQALVAVFTVAARRRPLLLLLEDWHVADEGSRQTLRQLVSLVSTHPLAVVVTFRPDYAPEWGNPESYTRIDLGPLTLAAATEVMQSVFGVDEVPEDIAEIFHKRTQGNPFFLEEVCETLREEERVVVEERVLHLEGVARELSLPTTVQSVIRSRFDRLDRPAQELLRLASVIGRDFSRTVLERADRSSSDVTTLLAELSSLGLVQQTSILPEPTFRFKHILTQEVVYDSLLQHQRKSLHGMVAEAMEALYPERETELAEVLAQHFERSESWEKAIHYARLAADRAARLARFREAMSLYDNIIESLSRLPSASRETLVDTLFDKEQAADHMGMRELQRSLHEQLLPLLEPERDSERLAEVYQRRGDLLSNQSRFEESEASIEKALEIRRQLSDPVGEASALRSLGYLRWHQGRLDEARSLNEQALALDREAGNVSGIRSDLHALGSLYQSLGDYETGVRYLEEVLELPGFQQVENQCSTLHIIGMTYRLNGELEKAMEYLERARRLLGDRFMPYYTSANRSHLADANRDLGRFDEAIELYKESVHAARLADSAMVKSWCAPKLVTVLLRLGRYDEALPYAVESVEVYQALTETKNEADMRAVVAELSERVGRYQQAQDAWGQVLEIRREMGDGRGEVEALEALGRCARGDDPAAARERYHEALERAEGLGDRKKQGELLNSVGILAWEDGRHEEALERYEAALAIFRELEEKPRVGFMLNSIGVTLKSLSRHDEARSRLEEALKHHRESGEQLLEGHALAILGDLLKEEGQHREALGRYETSLEIRRALGDKTGEGWMLLAAGQEHGALGANEQLLELVSKASELADESRDHALSEACREALKSIS